jgi:tRNA-splicing ligase RtcB (3'-phosphate/5'-hydroxy nucleic acid ligase)
VEGTLISEGLNEAPMVHRNIHEVIAAQNELGMLLRQFDPKLVRMSPTVERAED